MRRNQTQQANSRYKVPMTSLSRALLDVASDYEAKSNRDRGILVRQIEELTGEKRDLEASLLTLRRDIAAEKEAKVSAEQASEKFQLAAEEATAALKVERCRMIGALFLIADLRQGPQLQAEEKESLQEIEKIEKDEVLQEKEEDEDHEEEEEEDLIVPEASIQAKKGRRRGGRKKHNRKKKPNSAEEEDNLLAFLPDDELGSPLSKSTEAIKLEDTAYGYALAVAKRLEPRTAIEFVDACSQGKTGLFQTLLEPKSELHTQSEDTLYEAAQAVLSQGLDRASRCGHLRTCNLLLHAGARAERMSCDPTELEEPLLCHTTTLSYQSTEEVAVLAPALHAAVASGHDDIVKILITQGASANAVATTAGNGSTPLHMCAAHNRPHLAHFLVSKANARLETVDDAGRTPLQVATEHRWHAVAKVLKDPGVVFWARANRANRLCKEGEHALALESFELALAELEKLKQNKGGGKLFSASSNTASKNTKSTTSKMPTAANIMTLHNNRAKSLMACGQHLAARSSLDAAFAEINGDPLAYIAPYVKRCECHAKLLDHEKAIEGYLQLVDRYEHNENAENVTPDKIKEWRQAATRERTKAHLEAHEVLGITAEANLTEIKQAYRRLSLKNHPDRHASSTPEHQYRAHLQFQRVSAAYEKMLATARLRDMRASWTAGTVPAPARNANPFDDDYEEEDDASVATDDIEDDDDDDISTGFWKRHARP